MERVERLLLRYEFDGISQRELATEFLLTPDEVSAMICRAQTIENRRSRHGVKGFVHKMTTIRGRRLCVPLKPHLPFGKSIADACFQKLAQWNNTDLAFQRVPTLALFGEVREANPVLACILNTTMGTACATEQPSVR